MKETQIYIKECIFNEDYDILKKDAYILINDGRYIGIIKKGYCNGVSKSIFFGKQYIPNWIKNGLYIANIKVITPKYILIYEESVIEIKNPYVKNYSYYITLPEEFSKLFIQHIKGGYTIISIGTFDVIFIDEHVPTDVVKNMQIYSKEYWEKFFKKEEEMKLKLRESNLLKKIKAKRDNNVPTRLHYCHILPPESISRTSFIKEIKRKMGEDRLWENWVKFFPKNLNKEGLQIARNNEISAEYQKTFDTQWEKIHPHTNISFAIYKIENEYNIILRDKN